MEKEWADALTAAKVLKDSLSILYKQTNGFERDAAMTLFLKAKEITNALEVALAVAKEVAEGESTCE